MESQILGTIYGNCIGDAIGLLTEFMTKETAKKHYKRQIDKHGLEYNLKIVDIHRARWEDGDWTDDSDQMVLIMQSILDKNGEINAIDFAEKLKAWFDHGFPELGDIGGNGVGRLTHHVIRNPDFLTEPVKTAHDVWVKLGSNTASNGGVMRTSILGVYQYTDSDAIRQNTLELCKVTHADPRCQASCLAVTFAIAAMLRRENAYCQKGKYNIKAITDYAFEVAVQVFKGLEKEEEYKKELYKHMYPDQLEDLDLDEDNKIGYTFKTMGAGFWALNQKDFRKALTKITMEGGDADTNGAVAGAMLGCKLGHAALPKSWLTQMPNKDWLDQQIRRFMAFAFPEVQLQILPVLQVDHLEEHVSGTLYGHCIGDAIGLLTERMTKAKALKLVAVTTEGHVDLSYKLKNADEHRKMWETGDWTEDTDQMLLIMDMLIDGKGFVCPVNFAKRLKKWSNSGFVELGDTKGVGLEKFSIDVINHECFAFRPHEAARIIWEESGFNAASNGAIMRTSILGVYRYTNIAAIKRNTRAICQVTHADPRCAASCVAVTCAIAFMLQRAPRHFKHGHYDVKAIIQDAYNEALTVFDADETKKYGKELKRHMYTEKLADLNLDETGQMDHTFKTLGVGFWALRQNNFKDTLTAIVMEAGDTGTNGAVAGALLGCKLGHSHLAETAPNWLSELRHKEWFDEKVKGFLGFAFKDLSVTKPAADTSSKD